MRTGLLITVLWLWISPLFAAIEILDFDTPQQQRDFNELVEELRCLVCQNQNLAASNAELALDLRRKTYEMIRQGQSKEEVVTYMVDRYGDFVLYRPPFKATTLLLWLGPLLLLLVGLVVVLQVIRKQRQQQPITNAGSDAEAKATAILQEKPHV